MSVAYSESADNFTARIRPAFTLVRTESASSAPQVGRSSRLRLASNSSLLSLPNGGAAAFVDVLASYEPLLQEETSLALRRQVEAVLGSCSDTDAAQQRASKRSFIGLLLFLSGGGIVVHPRLSLRQNGNWLATWSGQPTGKLQIEIVSSRLAHVTAVGVAQRPFKASFSPRDELPHLPDQFARICRD